MDAHYLYVYISDYVLCLYKYRQTEFDMHLNSMPQQKSGFTVVKLLLSFLQDIIEFSPRYERLGNHRSLSKSASNLRVDAKASKDRTLGGH